MRYQHTKSDVYPTTFHFLTGPFDRKEAEKKVAETAKVEPEEVCLDLNEEFPPLGRTWYKGGHVVVWISDDEKKGLVAHELLHAVFACAHHLGFDYSDDSEEFYTYMLGWLTDEFYKYRKDS